MRHVSEMRDLGCCQTAIRAWGEQSKVQSEVSLPECGREFEFEIGEPRVFEVPLPLFERRHFYRSELS